VAVLIDTNILGRLANTSDPSNAVASAAVMKLHRCGEVLHITAQNLIEFRNFATRPIGANGLGLSAQIADGLAATYEATFPLLPETPDIFPAWKAIVTALAVVGKQVHDARLVAVCHVHGVSQLLTFNVAHFARLAAFGPKLIVLDPASV
jgi:predicted nucleic acid-binding protein